MAKAAGVSRTTVYAGLAEIKAAGKLAAKRCKATVMAQPAAKRIRASGGGRKKRTVTDQRLRRQTVISVDTKKKELMGDFRNAGWVSVGIDHDTAEFAVQSIKLLPKRLQQRRPLSRRLVSLAAKLTSTGS